jgi:hypothetical protein
MNYTILNVTLINSLAELTPELRDKIIHDVMTAMRKADPEAQKVSRVLALKQQGRTYREISKALNISQRDIAKIATNFGSR